MKGIAANVITSRLAARSGRHRRAVRLLSTLPLAAGHDVPGQPFLKRPPGDPPGRADFKEGELASGHRLVQVATTHSSEPARLGNPHYATPHQLKLVKLALTGHPDHLHRSFFVCLLVRTCPCYTNYTGGVAIRQSRLPIRRRDNVVGKQPACMRPAPGSGRVEQGTIRLEPRAWSSPGVLNLINLPNNLAQVQSPETAARFVETYGPLLYHYEGGRPAPATEALRPLLAQAEAVRLALRLLEA